MRKIKLYAVVSMDGYLTREDGDIDWILELDNPLKTDYGMREFLESVDTVLMNRNHYQMLLGYDLCFSVMTKPCIMVTEPGLTLGEGYEVEYIEASGGGFSDVIERFSSIKHEQGGDIWLAGDNRLIWAFFEENMIDEITLTMLPVTLGRGVKLFPDSFCERLWQTWRRKYYDNGVIQVVFRSTDNDVC